MHLDYMYIYGENTHFSGVQMVLVFYCFIVKEENNVYVHVHCLNYNSSEMCLNIFCFL